MSAAHEEATGRPLLSTLALIGAGVAAAVLGVVQAAPAAEAKLPLAKGDHVAIIGNTLADRMQHSGWLETYVHALYPELDLVFRNLGFSADELKKRPREDNFGSPDQWLAKCQASVVLCFFGYNEAFNAPGGIDGFKKDLAATIDGMLAQQYDGKSAPRLVFFSPIAHEDLKSPHLPDGSANNARLELYTAAMREVCAANNVAFVDLFTPTKDLYAKAARPLTMNGIHLLEHGDRAVAEVIVKDLFGAERPKQDEAFPERLRQAVLDRNDYWFSRYRVVEGYNVFGGRSKLAWFGQSNADVMMREMEIFDVMTANRDARVIAVAKGGDVVVKDDNLPPQVAVKTNIPGTLEGGKHAYLGGMEAIGKMKIAEGMEVNLFASEEMFPEVVNPVQMAVDPDGRLFVAMWPSYPHWNPTEPRLDKIVCLPDDDGDGVADRCVTFADGLNSVTGFEFWGGGMIVAALPELWFLKDSDGDGKADVKVRLLQPAEFAGRIRVACVGDSITAGFDAAAGQSYPAQLGKMLGDKWKVRNFGVSGSTLLKRGDKPYQLEKLFQAALEYQPQVVIIMLGTNDTKPQNWKFKEEFAADYKDLVERFAKLSSQPRIFICRPVPVPGKGNFGINQVGIQAQIPIIDEVAADSKTGIVDMHAAFQDHADLIPDRVHPNTAGAALMAKAVYKVLPGRDFEGELPAAAKKTG